MPPMPSAARASASVSPSAAAAAAASPNPARESASWPARRFVSAARTRAAARPTSRPPDIREHISARRSAAAGRALSGLPVLDGTRAEAGVLGAAPVDVLAPPAEQARVRLHLRPVVHI